MLARGFERRARRQRAGRKQAGEVAIVGRETREPAAARGRDALQPREIELRYHDLAVVVGEEPTLGPRDRRALLGADREHAHFVSFAEQIARETHVVASDVGVGDRENLTVA